MASAAVTIDGRTYPWGAVTANKDGKTVVLFAPNSQQQADFIAATEPNVLLHGSRGGGKSHVMRWDALVRCMSVPNFKCLVLRRTMPELRRSHLIYIDKETQDLTGEKCYNKSEFSVLFPKTHSLLVFGHCEDDSAIERYLSSEWDAIYFDELVTFELRAFLLISASARVKSNSGRIAIVRAGTNPVGVGATWVREYFIDKCPSAEEAPDYIPADWRAIAVQMDDNPDVDQESYDKRLRSLPSDALRRAYRYGEWVTEGQFFSEWRESKEGVPWHVIEEMPRHKNLPIHKLPWVEIVRAVDWGYSENEPGCCLWFACLPDDTYIAFQEYVFSGTIPKEVAKEIKARSQGMKIRYTVGDPNMWAEERGECIAETIRRNGVPMIEANNDRSSEENGWVRMHSMLTEIHNDGVQEKPQLRVLRGRKDGTGCPALIRAIPTAVVDPKKPADLIGPFEDPLDTTRYFCMSRPTRSRERVKSTLSPELLAIINAAKRRPVLGTESVRHR